MKLKSQLLNLSLVGLLLFLAGQLVVASSGDDSQAAINPEGTFSISHVVYQPTVDRKACKQSGGRYDNELDACIQDAENTIVVKKVTLDTQASAGAVYNISLSVIDSRARMCDLQGQSTFDGKVLTLQANGTAFDNNGDIYQKSCPVYIEYLDNDRITVYLKDVCNIDECGTNPVTNANRVK